jgi:hypothetical protein
MNKREGSRVGRVRRSNHRAAPANGARSDNLRLVGCYNPAVAATRPIGGLADLGWLGVVGFRRW